ncbi:hypothetical protein K523DRAFT_358393 [Schizophyllum commune Tattone D]|nr:hypothetical protein K523DRAFT_358393 [Schizophyllum commune Tattone D]
MSSGRPQRAHWPVNLSKRNLEHDPTHNAQSALPKKAKTASKVTSNRTKATPYVSTTSQSSQPHATPTTTNPPPSITIEDFPDDTPPPCSPKNPNTILELADSSDEEDDEDDEVEGGDSHKEDPEKQLTRMMRRWTGPIYTFFEPVPEIEYVVQSGGGT